MRRITTPLLASLSILVAGIETLSAQGFGSATQHHTTARHPGNSQPGSSSNKLDVETALSMITIEGTAVTRVTPQEIRLVLAVISEAAS